MYFGIAHVHSYVSIQNIIVLCITILVSRDFMWLALTRFPQETMVIELDRPSDLTRAYIVPSPRCFSPSGAQNNSGTYSEFVISSEFQIITISCLFEEVLPLSLFIICHTALDL